MASFDQAAYKFQLLHQLGEELKASQSMRKTFLSKPVLAIGLESNQVLSEAVKNLSEGKHPFGLSALFGKSAEKKSIESIQILGSAPSNKEEWKHILAYIELQSYMKELAVRWNAAAAELDLPIAETSPKGGLHAYNLFLIFLDAEKEAELEHEVLSQAKKLFTLWADVDSIISMQATLALRKRIKMLLLKELGLS